MNGGLNDISTKEVDLSGLKRLSKLKIDLRLVYNFILIDIIFYQKINSKSYNELQRCSILSALERNMIHLEILTEFKILLR